MLYQLNVLVVPRELRRHDAPRNLKGGLPYGKDGLPHGGLHAVIRSQLARRQLTSRFCVVQIWSRDVRLYQLDVLVVPRELRREDTARHLLGNVVKQWSRKSTPLQNRQLSVL